MKRILCGILAFSLTLSVLCLGARAAAPNSVSGLVSAALSQLDREEAANGYTEYGQWYGIPAGDWCDMFVSWCAEQAGLSLWVFPRSSLCTAHVQLFQTYGTYHPSMARGGTYIPKQGDVIFFYNYPEYPYGNILSHVGIVLCVENGHVFTIEGNTHTSRLDYPYYESVAPLCDEALESMDYVAVKHYPLDEPGIHGYAVPNYDDTSPLEHTGWVDLGKYEPLREIFDTLDAQGVLTGTSSYTFSPRYGMTRGDFLSVLMDLYGLRGWEAETRPFDDVPESSACYGAVMAARSAGIALGSDSNRFLPDVYISGTEAQAFISRTLAYAEREDQVFEFSEGDFSYLLTPYTIRADIASALYALLSEAPAPAASSDRLLFDGEALDWPMLKIDGSNYVPLEMLEQRFPALETAPEPATRPSGLPVPMGGANRVFLSETELRNGELSASVPSFDSQGVRYVMLRPAVDLFRIEIRWNEESMTIELF